MSAIVHLKGKEAPKAARSAMETMLFSRAEMDTWKDPGFQRPIRINAKVLEIAEQIKNNGGFIPGIITLGRLSATDKFFFLVDGQHRFEAFKISERLECIADVRSMIFDTMADMAEEFVNLNSRLVNMRPDDILRGLEESNPALKRIRTACQFVTYGQVRRGDSRSALISMSPLLRAWHMSSPETPAQNAPTATALARILDTAEADKIIAFLAIARAAWGSDPENYRLWGALNLTISMWMWKRLVGRERGGAARSLSLTIDQYRKCLMSVSASETYLDWLAGRSMNERDRSPCYNRLKAIFTKRLQQDSSTLVKLKSPPWASS